MINTQTEPRPEPTPELNNRLPRASGEGVRAADGGGSSSQPAPVEQPTLTNHLLEDLLNPSISALDLCNYHGLSLPELNDIIESQEFQIAKRTIESISNARRDLMQPEAETLALARMTDLLKDKPETENHAETTRKAAAQILRQSSKPTQPKAKPNPTKQHQISPPQRRPISQFQTQSRPQPRFGPQSENNFLNRISPSSFPPSDPFRFLQQRKFFPKQDPTSDIELKPIGEYRPQFSLNPNWPKSYNPNTPIKELTFQTWSVFCP